MQFNHDIFNIDARNICKAKTQQTLSCYRLHIMSYDLFLSPRYSNLMAIKENMLTILYCYKLNMKSM